MGLSFNSHNSFINPSSSHNGRLGSFFTSPIGLSLLLTLHSILAPQSLPPAAYHNASGWAKVQLNDKSILPSQEGNPGRRYEEERPWDHWFIWLPPRRQDAEDFQLLLRLKLIIKMNIRKGSGKSHCFLPRIPIWPLISCETIQKALTSLSLSVLIYKMEIILIPI